MKKLALSVLVLAACGGPGMSDVDASGQTDSGRDHDGGGTPVDGGDAVDSGGTPGCGTARPDVSGIMGTEGLVIARDGTIYYSQDGAVGRLPPGGAQDDGFVVIDGTSTVWGLALDAANANLYVAMPGTAIYKIDLTAATPAAVSFFPTSGQPNGMTMGPDGFVYYSDFGAGRVYRLDPGTANRTEVTAQIIDGANGLAFEAAGTLLVLSYQAGTLLRLTLTDGVETDRAMVTDGLGNPDGVAIGADGTIYVTNNSGAAVLSVQGATHAPFRSGIAVPANLEFGAGALNCHDLYVTSARELQRIEDVGEGLALPWH